MSLSHFLDKYSKMLLLLKSNEDEEEQENQKSQTEYFRKANDFNLDNLKRKRNQNSKNFEIDFSIENININNVRDLIKNKNEFNKKVYDDFRMENNHSEILFNIDKFSNNNEDISIEAGDLLNEINFTESAASTYRDKIDKKIGSIIKPTNTFNNRVAQDIEYQLDLQKAKRKQRNKDNNFNNIIGNRKLSANKFGSGILNNRNIANSVFENKFNSDNLTNNFQSALKKDILFSNSSKKNAENNKNNNSNLNFNINFGEEQEKKEEEEENLNNLNNLNIDDLKNENEELNFNDLNKNQFNEIAIEADYTKGPNNININFTNYGVMNNNLINYHLPKMNSLNSKMLDLFREINNTKPKPSYNSITNINNLNLQSSKFNSNDANKNYIIDSIINNNINNLQSSLNKNVNNNNLNNLKDLNNNKNLVNTPLKEDYFSELFKSVENKNTVKSLTDRINQLKRKNNFAESNIKGVNNTNNIFNLNSKFSNLDKIFKNNSNLTAKNSLNNKINSLNSQFNQNINAPLISKPLMRSGNLQFDQVQTNQNNFDLLEAQLDSLKKKTTKTKMSVNKLNNLIIGDYSCSNNFRNLDDKINKFNYDKLNQSLEECENLINDLRDSKSSKRNNLNAKNNLFNNSNYDFDNL